MRVTRTLVLALVAALALSACAGAGSGAESGRPSPTPGHSRDVAAAYRCLADHSPWAVDLDAAYRAWYAATGTRHALRGGTITGSATMSFTRDHSPRWSFAANGLAYELFFDDGTHETTRLDLELAGDFAVPEPGGVLVLREVEVTEATTVTAARAADGTDSSRTRVAAPSFPWDGPNGTALSFTCTEHRLLVSAPGEVPATWDLSPG